MLEKLWQKYIVYEREFGIDHPSTRKIWFDYKEEKYKQMETRFMKVTVLKR